jgi:hypothetical protein
MVAQLFLHLAAPLSAALDEQFIFSYKNSCLLKFRSSNMQYLLKNALSKLSNGIKLMTGSCALLQIERSFK